VGGAFARDRAVTDDEIVEAITTALKPWKPQYRQVETGKRAGQMEAKSSRDVQRDIVKAVRFEMLRFRTSSVPHFFSREAIRKTRHDARDIIKTIDQLIRLVAAKTLSPELQLRLGQHTNVIGSQVDRAKMPIPRLLDGLYEIRAVCDQADKKQPGADQIKLWCARTAIRLINSFSETRPSAGSANTPYCRIAGLFYQGTTKKPATLRRICQDVLRPYQEFLPPS
jgi:hypothetical protein